MKHLATIQSEFLKEARKWDDLSLEEQKAYLSRHPKSKRKITAKPESKVKQQGRGVTELPSTADLMDKFKVEGFATDSEDGKSFYVTNKKGYDVYFKPNDDGFDAAVIGAKSEIPLDDVGSTYEDLKEIVKSINGKWMKEYDPDYNRW